MSLFSRKKEVSSHQHSEDTPKKDSTSVLKSVVFSETGFGDIEPGHMDLFLKQTLNDKNLSTVGQQLVISAGEINSAFKTLETFYGDHKTFSEWRTWIKTAITTGRITLKGETADIDFTERAALSQIERGYSILEGVYNEVKEKDGMYFDDEVESP